MKKFIAILVLFSFVSAKDYPQRIISFGPSITEELYILGVGNRVIGNTTYCNMPKDAKKKEKIGTILEINTEKILSLEPDLVIAIQLTPKKTLERVRDLGIRVEVFENPENFHQICKNFIRLGKIVGKERKAERIIKRIENEIFKIREKIEEKEKPKVLVQIGANPLWVATKDSFINELIEYAGGVNIVEETKSGLYSVEKVVAKNPDIIIITTMGISEEKEKEGWKRFPEINAVQNNRIYVIDADKICRPQPLRFVKTIRELVSIIHP
ncbi:TPA: ABC transporter substrate-binding protein [bacterium]|nr:ABC transporter substrate-binding protein [bacterium]